MTRRILPPDDPNLETELRDWGVIHPDYRADKYKAWFLERLPETIVTEGIFTCVFYRRNDWLFNWADHAGIDRKDIACDLQTSGNIYKATMHIPRTLFQDEPCDYYAAIFLQPIYPITGFQHRLARIHNNITTLNNQPFNYDMAQTQQQKAQNALKQILVGWQKDDQTRKEAIERQANAVEALKALCTDENRELLFVGNSLFFRELGLKLNFANESTITEKEGFVLRDFLKDFPNGIRNYDFSRSHIKEVILDKKTNTKFEKHATFSTVEVFDIKKIEKDEKTEAETSK